MADQDFQITPPPSDNPLASGLPVPDLTVPKVPESPATADPKIKLLKILVATIVIVLLLSLIVPYLKPKKSDPTGLPTPTPLTNNPLLSPVPSDISSQNELLGKYQATFDTVEKDIRNYQDFPPPVLDPDISL
ncbi:MAG: hypothetical protein WC686_04510 [Candidatus Shapirobacteria bacterium]|jgi:hypothetical protein